MKLNLKDKILKRITPIPNMIYEIKKEISGYRKVPTINGVDCHGAGHIHVYMTLKCNLKCHFCINEVVAGNGVKKVKEEKDVGRWIYYLNKIYNFKEFYINGGEHFNLPYFIDVLNGLRKCNVRMFTNVPRRGLDSIRRIQKNDNNIFLCCSYHPLQDEPLNMFIERCKNIPKNILWTPSIVKIPGISGRMFLDGFRQHGKYGEVAELILPENFNPKKRDVMCDSREHVIGPDLKVYRCLYNLVNQIGGTEIENYEFVFKKEKCSNYPMCMACSSAYAQIEFI